MKRPSNAVLSNLARIRFRLNRLPLRLFHGALLGIALGTLFSIAAQWIGSALLEQKPAAVAEATPAPQPAPAPKAFLSGETDSDGDGIPNTWETQFGHNPDDDADATSDFDNDGLTATQEYHLWLDTNGQAGNPLGTWNVTPLEVPEERDVRWVWPVAINNLGDVLVQAGTGDPSMAKPFLVKSDGSWLEINGLHPNGHTEAYDMNDLGEIVGRSYSADWSVGSAFKGAPACGAVPITLDGDSDLYPVKINNHGDWIGYFYPPPLYEHRNAYVVGGENQAKGDWWPDTWFTDINDAGEAMGSFWDPLEGIYHTFLAYGPWRFDTGFLGAQPEFDDLTGIWHWSSAMNQWGEFTGSAGGQTGDEYDYRAFHYNGRFTPLGLGGNSADYISPEDVNSDNTIVGYAADWTSGIYGAFIWRDGVVSVQGAVLGGYGTRCSPRYWQASDGVHHSGKINKIPVD